MKSILYAGAALMLGASIYGFVDFKSTSRNKEFKELYNEEKPAPVVNATRVPVITRVAEEKKIEPVAKKETKKPVAKKTAKKKKKLNHKLFSRAPLREDYIDKELKLEESKSSKTKETEL